MRTDYNKIRNAVTRVREADEENREFEEASTELRGLVKRAIDNNCRLSYLSDVVRDIPAVYEIVVEEIKKREFYRDLVNWMK